MPLFVTVTPGTTVTSQTTLDAATLNLLGTPSVQVKGTVDGGSLSLAPGSVGNAALAANSVTSDKIADGTIATADLADGSVTNPKLATDSVSTIKIQDDAVTYDKIQNVTAQRLLGRHSGASGSVEEISLGTGLEFDGSTLNASQAVLPNFQVTQFNTTADYALPNANFRSTAVEISEFQTSITPSSDTSGVLVNFNIGFDVNDNTTVAFILERAIGAGAYFEIGSGATVSPPRLYGIACIPVSFDNLVKMASVQYYDTPATTSEVTYKLKAYSSATGATLYINQDYNSTQSNVSSRMILQEILNPA